MHIEQFKSQFIDLLRPNRYKVFFHSNFIEFDPRLAVLCKNVSYPFFTFNTITSFYNNHNNTSIEKIDFDPVSFTFLIDVDKKILKFIEAWKKTIIDKNYRFGYKDDYKLDIEISLLHFNELEITSCTLKNAILLNADPIDLSNDSRDMVSEIVISIGYDTVEYSHGIELFDYKLSDLKSKFKI